MQIRFLLGPAGSGKTFRCLAEIRDALQSDPEGPPLLMLAPKQATFQLERQLLADPELPGYTRLQILSFERLADFILQQFGGSSAGILEEEGRVMVLRALLGRNQSKLKIFHATARLPGFAQQLNLLLRELQRQQVSPRQLAALADNFEAQPTLAGKLQDAALMLGAYLDWLRTHQLEDANCLLDLAATALRKAVSSRKIALRVGGLWLDGFAEMTPQELELLTAFVPICDRATLAFCVDAESRDETSWLSGWAAVNATFNQCHERLASVPGSKITVEKLPRDPRRSRFAGSASLQKFERDVARVFAAGNAPQEPSARNEQLTFEIEERSAAVRLVCCATPEQEATLAAREILKCVRDGGRFRDAAVLLRRLAGYDDVFRRVFLRYQIPFFLDRREPIAHHPLAELTRCALRIAAFGWRHEDWFGALKSGLVTDNEAAVDRLENEALARGWQGNVWLQPLAAPDDADLESSLNRWLQEMLPPFVRWNEALVSLQRRPAAHQLAAAIRELWSRLDVERTLQRWSSPPWSDPVRPADARTAIHLTVLEEMANWLDNLERAFADESHSLAEWLPILEAGLSNLTVGVIPPALDQVLIGAVDRSRNPELKLVLLPGWNEGVFPALATPGPLLSDTERETLAAASVRLGPTRRQQLGNERYYAYIAGTRASGRVIVTRALQDSAGQPLNPSPFLDSLQRITGVAEETFEGVAGWAGSEHLSELATSVLRAGTDSRPGGALERLRQLPGLQPILGKWHQLSEASRALRLSPEAAAGIYGNELHSSVSGLEDFAACPFKFFVARGLRLQERKEFEFDDRDKGSFQHEVLREFHRRVRAAGKRWRDLAPAAARELVMEVGRELLPDFSGGRFAAGGAARFTGEVLIERLGRLMHMLVEWMPQYEFDPELVEIGFGLEAGGLPPWRIDLPQGRALLLRGRIDRVDLCRAGGKTFAVVIDYKSSVRTLHPTRLHHGLDLQLLSYLGVLHNLALPERFFGAKVLSPAGVFYVPLNGGGTGPGRTRSEVLAERDSARRAAYQHSGRFLAEALKHFDNRDAIKGDQFKFARNKGGSLRAVGNEAMSAEEFDALRQKVEGHLRDYGRRIFEGEAEVAPYRIGQHVACERCDFRAGCRFDSWTQPYRELKAPPKSK